MSNAVQILWITSYCALLATAIVTDIRSLRIPNLIPLLLVVLFFVVAAIVLSSRSVDWGSHLLAAGIVLVIGIGLFAWGKFGGGDVKLLTAVALWHGLHLLPALLIRVAFLGGALALICLVVRHAGIASFLSRRGIDSVVLEKGGGIPYAIAIAGASGLLLPYLPLLSH